MMIHCSQTTEESMQGPDNSIKNTSRVSQHNAQPTTNGFQVLEKQEVHACKDSFWCFLPNIPMVKPECFCLWFLMNKTTPFQSLREDTHGTELWSDTEISKAKLFGCLLQSSWSHCSIQKACHPQNHKEAQ